MNTTDGHRKHARNERNERDELDDRDELDEQDELDDPEERDEREGKDEEGGRGERDGRGEPDRVSAAEALRGAVEQLTELLGRAPETVSALTPTETGWTARIEFVEVERVPETTSVLASYEVALGHDGHLLGYERGKRYTRAQIDDKDGG
ncbi:gas vesicle protein [Streptomyces filamentosus]|uniref:gas vesicle protein GvpO n=1 Tax=Streptomyces filamentosus TaxID=67294 RepID=UPI00331CEDC5